MISKLVFLLDTNTLSNLAMACTHAKSTHAKSKLALRSLLSPGRSLCRLALRRSLLSAPDHAPDHASDCPRLPQAAPDHAPGCPRLTQANPG